MGLKIFFVTKRREVGRQICLNPIHPLNTRVTFVRSSILPALPIN